MYVVGVLAFSEDGLGEVTEIRLALERLGYTVHLEQMGYSLDSPEIGMFEEGSLLLWLGRCYSDTERCREIAETYVREGVDLILAMRPPSVHAALAASAGTSIPVVFTHVCDPAIEGIIDSLDGSERRITGVRDTWLLTAGERLSLLQQIVPAPIVVHAFYNPGSAVSAGEAEILNQAAEDIGVELRLHPAQDTAEVGRELAGMHIHQDHALLRTSDPLFDSVSGLMGVTARENYIPYVGLHLEEIERCGALFVLDQRGVGSQAATLIDRVLKGEEPASIAAVDPERRFLGVNLQAAQDLGLVVAQSVLERAQVVIHERERTTLGARLFLVLFIVAFSMVLTVAIAAQYGLRALIIAGAAAMVINAFSLWVYINYRIIHPIRELTVAAEKIGVGNLEADIGEAHVEDEIGVLGRTFRRMRSNLKYTQTKLERLNASLEQQIIERTAALRKLQGTQKELELANKRIIDADDNSRFSLTTYIHDEILVPLDELNDLARRCGDGAMADLANQVERRLRKVRFDLSVPIIHDMRVELRRLLQETLPLMYPESRQTRLSIDLAGLNHTHELEPACSVLLYRFVRGAASNVYRHAHARHIWVKSSHDGLRLNLSVSDDGIGFDPGQIEQFIDQDHYFFHDIQIRARQLGGELSIQSQPGAGASLEISVPVLAVDGASVIGNKTRRGSKASKHASH